METNSPHEEYGEPKHARMLVESLPWAFIVMDFMRPGSDFFHSLLDGHPQVLNVPGTLLLALPKIINDHKGQSSRLELAKSITFDPRIDGLFDSRQNSKERWDELGPSRQEHFQVDRTYFLHLLDFFTSDLEDPGFRDWFLAFHIAYNISSGVDPRESRLLVFHLHYYRDRAEFEPKRGTSYILLTRDPREGVVSSLYNRPVSHKNYAHPAVISNMFKVYSTIFNDMLEEPRVIIIPLKALHLFPEETMRDVAVHYGLDWHECLLESTYHGLSWWGDRWSFPRTGFNPDFGTKHPWREVLHPRDVCVLEAVYGAEFRVFGYKPVCLIKARKIKMFLAFILVLLPASYELDAIRHRFRQSHGWRSGLGICTEGVQHYARRVRYMLQRLFSNPWTEQGRVNLCARHEVG